MFSGFQLNTFDEEFREKYLAPIEEDTGEDKLLLVNLKEPVRVLPILLSPFSFFYIYNFYFELDWLRSFRDEKYRERRVNRRLRRPFHRGRSSCSPSVFHVF